MSDTLKKLQEKIVFSSDVELHKLVDEAEAENEKLRDRIEELERPWTQIDYGNEDSLPDIGLPVVCIIRHFNTRVRIESILVRVKEDDVTWRTADDSSQLANDWEPIRWKEKKTQEPE